MYQGSEAVRLDAYGQGTLGRQSAAPSFEVIEGAGLDAEARRGVSAQFAARARVAIVAILCVAALCIARVGIFSAAVGVLAENTSMRTELKQAKSTQSDLRIERSVLSNNTRIDRIATQTYGMVAAEGTEQMVAGATTAELASEDASSEDSASVSASDSADTHDSQASGSSEDGAEDVASEATDASEADALENVVVSQGDGQAAGSNAADVD